MPPLLDQFESLISRDPARRGLIGQGTPLASRVESAHEASGRHCALLPGHLAAAADHLARHATCVGLVTGFYVPFAEPPAAETDGPPGALLLAGALEACGIEAWVITDAWCAGAVRAAAAAWEFDPRRLIVAPAEPGEPPETFFRRDPGTRLSHLVAVERVGPGHTLASLAAQPRASAPPLERFADLVPPEARDHCHNMRGEIIDDQTPPLHRLFEHLKLHRSGARTVGIGDGGNEIGMGSIPWEELARRLDGAHAPRVPCRIATDWTIVAGTSNWGAAALAAAVLLLRGRTAAVRPWDREHERHVLERMVEHGPAVDGATRRREPTVDGLPFLTYIQPWEGIRHLLGFEN